MFGSDRFVADRAGGMFAKAVFLMCAALFAAPAVSWAATASTAGIAGNAATAPNASAQDQAEFTLGQLMRLLAQRKHGEVTYAEKDYLGILDRPVKSSGVLVYDAPDHLEKRTLKPRRESLVLDGDRLTVQRGRRTYRMQLSAYPQVAPFVAAVRDTLAGNEEGLERVFNVALTGAMEGWKLQLVPLDQKVARKVERVEIGGARDEIRSVEILQVDGDRSVMTLGPPADAPAPSSGSSGSSGSSRSSEALGASRASGRSGIDMSGDER